MGRSDVRELSLSYSVKGVNKGVGMDQTKGFDTCIRSRIDQESWTQQANKEAQEVKGEGA